MKRARLLAFVITAAMATTVFLGGTVARYQTSANIDDTATVAKWGVKLTMAGNLYGYNYTNGDVDASKPTTSSEDDQISVKADNFGSTTEIVDNVAPGTRGDSFRISLTGKTEVDVLLTAKITAQDIYLAKGTYAILQKIDVTDADDFNAIKNSGETLYTVTGTVVSKADSYASGTNYYILENQVTVAAEGYHPVKYSLNGVTDKKITEIATDLANRISSVADSDETNAGVTFENVTKKIEANVDLNDTTHGVDLDSEVITWSWVISATPESELDDTNKKDTILGTLINNDTTKSTYVVQIVDSSTITVLTVDTDTASDTFGCVYVGEKPTTNPENAEVGSVKTSFSIKITVSQVD